MGIASHALAVLFLPRLVREFFRPNGVGAPDDLMHEASVQALAMGRQLALFDGKASPGGEIATAVLPGEMPLAMFLNAALLIVVLGVVGAALAV